jgi:2-dehydropantoate 2-reductase
MRMKIGIVGAGGVGGYFGGKLAKAGHEVSFLARGEHLAAINKNGLTIKSFQGDFNVYNIKANDSLKDFGKVDIAIIAVKAWQLKEIAQDLIHIVGQNTIVLPLQNGISAIDELKGQVSQDRFVGGLCRIMSKIESPAVINHFGVDPTITFGEIDRTISKRCEKLLEVFSNAGIKATISSDITAELWRKFIVICVGGLLAVTKTTYGELRELPETRDMMIGLLKEIYSVSQKLEINIEPDFVDKSICLIDSYPYDSTASLTRDIWNGKPSEIEYQNGTVVKLSRKLLIDTPINEFVCNCILPMEIKARSKQ